MTIILELPADLQDEVLARAEVNGSNMEETIVRLLRESVNSTNPDQRLSTPYQRLEPGLYPDETLGDETDYQPVPLRPVGTISARLIPAGRLMPAVFPDE